MKLEMNIYDAIPMLNGMLNISGFCRIILNKVGTWINTKTRRQEFYTVKPGFNEVDVEIMNKGMQDVAEFCHAHVLKLPSECNDKSIYAKYVVETLKELRSVISMPYLRENHTSIAKKTFTDKMRIAINRNGKPCYFTEKDITEINAGIIKMADTFSRLKFTL